MEVKCVVFTILLLSLNMSLTSSNNYGSYGGNNGQYNPYNPYPYPCQCPYPLTPNPGPNPNPSSPTNVVAFTFTRARKNNQCLNLHMCFLQFDNEVTKINAITYPRYGAFQATVPGLYLLTFSLALGGSAMPRVSLRKNNDIVSAVNGSSSPNATTNHFPVTSSILLQLQPQDAVYLVIEDGDVVESPNTLQGPLNSFSGYLVAPIFPANMTSNQQPGGGGGGAGFPGAPGAAPGFSGAPGFPGTNPGMQKDGFNMFNPSNMPFPNNIHGMPNFPMGGRADEDEIEYETSEK